MSEHPRFIRWNDYRETYRLAEINDSQCKLLIVSDDQLEIMRRAMKSVRKRSNWVDQEDADGYLTPDDEDWDDISALVDDLEYKLMSICDYVTLDDANERVGINELTPDARLHVTADGNELTARLENQTANPVLQFSDGAYASYIAMRQGLLLFGDNIAYGDFSSRVRISPTGLGIGLTPDYALDVSGAAQIGGAFGCNGQAPQSAYNTVGAASDLTTVIALANDLLQALQNVGICDT